MKTCLNGWKLASRAALYAVVGALASCGGSDNSSSPPAPQASQQFQIATFMAPQNDMLEPEPFPGQGPAFPAFTDQTLRQIAHVSIGGDAVKVKFSNEFGTAPLTLDAVHLARSTGQGTIDTSTDLPLTFNGATTVTIPAGQEIFSDAVKIDVQPLTDLAISIFMKQAVVRTAHRASTTTSFIGSGDLTASAGIPNAILSKTTYYMPEVDVIRPSKVNVVVAFGDSITDGTASTIDGYNSWPNQLSAIANANFPVSVVNSGLGGNRWVKTDVGPCGLCRFERDVLNVSGATHVILFLGINDIGLGYVYDNAFQDPTQIVTADQITKNIQAAIDMAKAKGLKVYLGTILPYKGSFYYTTGQPTEVPFGMSAPYNGEAIREAVNDFIRNNKTVDGVLDFASGMQSPTDPLQQNPVFNSGDNLHPNAAGYATIAKQVPLALLK